MVGAWVCVSGGGGGWKGDPDDAHNPGWGDGRSCSRCGVYCPWGSRPKPTHQASTSCRLFLSACGLPCCPADRGAVYCVCMCTVQQLGCNSGSGTPCLPCTHHMPSTPRSQPLMTLPWPSVKENGVPRSTDESNFVPSTRRPCVQQMQQQVVVLVVERLELCCLAWSLLAV